MRLIDDIVDVAKIESGQLEINNTIINLAAVFDELNGVFSKELIRKNKNNIDLILDHNHFTPEMNILADEVRLKQVLSNLLGNAIKFTESGQVRFGIKGVIDSQIQFYVKDTGIGIRKDKMEIIFDRFTQAIDDKSKLYGGTGLGLSISKNLIELMGGEISLTSIPGKGTEFVFSLPFHVVDIKNPEIKNAISLAEGQWENRTIHIVENNPSGYMLLKEILKSSKAKLLWSKDGDSALKDFFDHKNLDLVLLDMNVPKTSGFEVAMTMKSERPDIPVIAQTAYAISGERHKSIDAGCDDYISKPIKIHELIYILNKYLDSQ